MKNYCTAASPPCFTRYADEDESVVCSRQHCPTRNLMRQKQAFAEFKGYIPSLSREAAVRGGGLDWRYTQVEDE